MAVKKTPEPDYAPPTTGGSFVRQKDGSLREIPPEAPAPNPSPEPAAPPADSNI